MRLTSLSRSVVGKRALVTGAASGMGRATAHLFADEGARVAVVDVGQERVDAVVREIRDAHGADAAMGVEADISDLHALHNLMDTVTEAFGGLDILVNNAGTVLTTSPQQDEDEFVARWHKSLAVNLTAHAHLVRLALPHFQAVGSGRVVNIGSTESIASATGMIAYTTTKSGVVGLTKSLAVELGPLGVTVNCICPGPVHTGMTAGMPLEEREAYAKQRVPVGRYGYPEEVAQMTLSMCLPAASFLNGAVVTVDGGMSIFRSRG